MTYRTSLLLLIGSLSLAAAEPAIPRLTGIATSPNPPVKGQPFAFTITGAGFDAEKAMVSLAGPGCETPCRVGSLTGDATQVGGATVLTSGSFTVTAQNGPGGVSNSLPLTVAGATDTTPKLTAIKTSPSPWAPGQPFTFEIGGSGFDASKAVASFSGKGCETPCSVTGLTGSATQLTGATVLSGGAYAVTVRNGAGGPESNSLALAGPAAKARTPRLTGIKTAPISPVKGMPFTFTIAGSDFDAPAAIASFSGPGCETACTVSGLTGSSSQLNGATVVVGGIYAVTLRNGNGGTPSNAVTLKVQ